MRSAFTVPFPARKVVLDLDVIGPGRCRDLDPYAIAIRFARSGHFRFGPRVPGARPRQDGRRVARWCRGRYRVSVMATDEFPPGGEVIATGSFRVR